MILCQSVCLSLSVCVCLSLVCVCLLCLSVCPRFTSCFQLVHLLLPASHWQPVQVLSPALMCSYLSFSTFMTSVFKPNEPVIFSSPPKKCGAIEIGRADVC